MSVVAIAGVSAPTFWLGILLVLLLSAELNLLPSAGRLPYGVDAASFTGLHIVDAVLAGRLRPPGAHHRATSLLPALTLAFNMIGIIARITRGAIIDVAQEEFITTAVAKGLTRSTIIRHHLLPNATVPIVTIIGLELGVLISGSIIVEVVFSWPGSRHAALSGDLGARHSADDRHRGHLHDAVHLHQRRRSTSSTSWSIRASARRRRAEGGRP